MDIIDRASQEEEYILSSQLAVAKKAHRIHPKGTCHYCDEVVKGDKLFCDADCLMDYDREQLIKKRTGRNE